MTRAKKSPLYVCNQMPDRVSDRKATMKIEIEVPYARVIDNLTSAREQGSRYWCRIKVWPADSKDAYAFDRGVAWLITLFDGDTTISTKPVSTATIKAGLVVMAERYPAHFGHLISGQGDAETGDVLLQCIVFGEMVYG